MSQIMKLGFLVILIVLVTLIVFGSEVLLLAAEDDGSKIAIIAPKNGEIVGETFALKYDLTKGSKAAHGHVYLDGQRQKGFEGTFRGVSKGRHEIKVVAATHEHGELAAADSVTVEVK